MEGQVVLQQLNSALASQLFLVLADPRADVGEDVEAQLSELEGVLRGVLDDVQENVDDASLGEFELEEVEFRAVEEGLEAGGPALEVGVDGEEVDHESVRLLLEEVVGDERGQVGEDVQAVDLDLLELGGLPAVEKGRGLLVVDVHQNGGNEVFVLEGLVGGGVLGLADDVEDACPDELLELYVFVSGCKDGFEGLLGAFANEVDVGAKLIVSCIEEKDIKKGVRV